MQRTVPLLNACRAVASAACGATIAFLLGAAAHAQDAAPDAAPYIPSGYEIETIPLPKDVPFHVTGLDINDNGDVAVATRLGDVWILGADTATGTPEADDWRLFAEGLAEPTGLLWDEDGSILVGQKPELTRLLDTDGDGAADSFANVANGWDFHDNYHEFNFGPVRDRDGNFVGTLNLGHGNPDGFAWGNRVMVSAGGHRGWAYRVGEDGELDYFASGLRSPAGLGVSPEGDIFYTDNQGDWVPTSKLHVLKKDGFYGHPSSLRDHPAYTIEKILSMTIEDFAEMSETPVVWIPHQEVANSPGNPAWDGTDGGFGPFSGQIFMGDQTQSNVFRIMLEEVNGERQGAVINFADDFQSGNIRLAFHPEGDLWVGQTARGWAATGGEPFGLQRVVWDGKTTPFELHEMRMTEDGFRLTFTDAIDTETVTPDAFAAERWRYDYSDAYGSEKIDLTAVSIADVSAVDDRTVLISVNAIPETVMALDFAGLRAKSGGEPSVSRVFYTVNAVMGAAGSNDNAQ